MEWPHKLEVSGALALAALFLPCASHAFENKCTHPRMAGKARELLSSREPGKYAELIAYSATIEDGTDKEDVLSDFVINVPGVVHIETPPVFNHFYHARTQQGLTVPGLQTALGVNLESARTRAVRYWQDALKLYAQSRQGEAYFVLGRSLHLMQDMHQPGHVHNDPHVPPGSVPASLLQYRGLNGHDLSPLEHSVELACIPSGGANIPTGNAVGVPVAGMPGGPDGFIVSSALEAYGSVNFPGNLGAFVPQGAGSIEVQGRMLTASFARQIADENLPPVDRGNKCLTQDHWILTDLLITGDPGLCMVPGQGLTYDGKISDGFDNDWWLIAPGRFYIEQYDNVFTGSGEILNDVLTISRVTRGVEMGAGYLKLFADTVDGVAPQAVLKKANGDALARNGLTFLSDSLSFRIDAEDLGKTGFPVSGIYHIEVARSGDPTPVSEQFFGGVAGPMTANFSVLEDGIYDVRVHDGLGKFAQLTVVVDANGSAKAVVPADPDPNSPPSGPMPPPTPGLGVEINANTGEFGQACGGPSNSGHMPLCVRTQAGGEQCYPDPQQNLCITWACSSSGNYDIPVEFQDDRGNWARTHTIHCHDAPPKIKSCTAGQPCQVISLPPNFDVAKSTINAVIEEGTPYCGSPQACQIIEQIGGGKCEIVNSNGCVAIRYSRAYPKSLVAAAGMFYAPPENQDYLRNSPFTVNFDLNGGYSIASFTYPTHSQRGATVRLPALNQKWKTCADDGLTCIANNNGGGGPPWGNGPPPTPQPNPLPPSPQPNVPAPPLDPMQQAAAAMGQAILGATIRIGNAATIFGTALTLTSTAKVPSYQPTAGAQACRWTGTTWGCEGPASASCSGGTCLFTADLLHASTWAFLAPLPAFYPDLTAPNLSELNISENGVAWNAPGPLIQTTSPFVRMTARDPPSGVELISGLAVSSASLPFASSDPSLLLHLHLDEGSGSQLFDSGPYHSTGTINLTPVWSAGRFGSSLEFTGVSGQQASVPVAARLNSGPFSIEAWVYPTDNVNNHLIARKGTGFNQVFTFVTTNGKLQASVGDGGVGYAVTSADALPLNQWSLVAMSFDGSKLRIFANGGQKGEVPAAYAGSDSTVVFGANWKGRLDEIRILTRGLGRAEAALDYHRGFAAYATGDGWKTSKLAAQHDYGAASEGQPGPAVLSASGFSLARSTSDVNIEIAVADVEGHITSTAFQVRVAPADTTPLAFSNAEISADTSSWYPQGAVPVPGRIDFRAKVKDPALGDALRSGVATSTQTTPFTADPYTQLLLHLDEGSGAPIDSSQRASVVTIQNGPAWVPGRFGTALEFTSSFQYLMPSASPAGLDAPNWTANVWVYPSETANGYIISKLNDARYGFVLRGASGRPQLNVHNSVNGFAGGVTITAPDILPLNQWTSLTATSDQSVIRLYVNGELKASAPGYMEPNSAAFMIGSSNGGAGNWKGRLDEIRFMSRPQSPAEVLLDYHRGYAALFSSNGGVNWTMPALSYGAAASGDLEAVLSVSSLTLANSLTSNSIQIFAADGAGNVSSAAYVLPAALDATAPAPPVIVSTRLAGSGAAAVAWQYAPGEVPASYSLYRATAAISSLSGLLPVATTSALSALDAPSPALGDVHYYALTATDIQGNVSAPSTSVEARFDHTPPLTTLAVHGSSFTASGTIYALPSSTLALSAADLGTAVSGVDAVALVLDGTPVAASTAPFRLSEGAHHLSYFATDAAGNVEAARESTVAVDATPPASTFTVAGGSSRDSLDRVIIVAGQEVILTAQDAMAGVSRISYRVDSGTWSDVTSSVTIAEGQHVLEFYAVDALGNAETPRAQSFVVALAPVSGVAVVDQTPNSFRLLWSSMTGAAGYVVVVSSSPDFGTVIFSTAVDSRQVAVAGLQPSTTYFVRLAFFSDSNDGLPVVVTAVTSAPDVVAPALVLFPPDGSTVTTATPIFIASYSDVGRGIDASSVRLALDGAALTSSAAVTASSASFAPSTAISQGTHTVTASVSDLAGNRTAASSIFLVDSLAPVTTLLVNGLPALSTNFVLVSTDVVGFIAADAGTGVLEILYAPDGATESVFGSTFTLSPGVHSLSFRSRDRAGNLEMVRAVLIAATNPVYDAAPPLVRLDFPGGSGLGVEQAVGGVVDVRGAVSDSSTLTWTLEAAPGAAATSGFAVVATGAGNASGVFASWNTAALSGVQTLRLRAVDAYGNAASTSAQVFVGAPVMTFAIGRKDSNAIVSTLKGPTGIAVRSDGAVWVASTENDKILLINPAGILLGEAGHVPGHSGREKERGKKEKDRDADEVESAENPSFKTPQGLALDAADNLYVADRDLNRVVKFSPDGRVLLLQLGKAGSGNGELRHPFDVAVDGNGDVYVADSGNRRIQVFNSAGGYLRQFGAGVLLSTSEVRGIALTVEGLWVSDKEQERVFLFSRAGTLIQSIGGADSAVGEISRMRGLASDRLGSLYVVEPNRDRVQKFDPRGKGLLAFGSKAELSQADKLAKRYLTQPIDAAVAPDGSLWITDTGRDRIVRYALPVSGYGAAAYSAGDGPASSSSAEPARRIVDHQDGAKVERDDGAGVRVPKGALSADLEITVDKGDENQDKEQKEAKRRDLKIKAVSEEVQYGPEGTTFNAPVTLTLPYDANLIASLGIREDDLKVYYWNPTLKDWQAMPSTVDKQNKTVNALTTHFSAYQVGGLGGVGVAAIDDFGLRDGYAFPNPSRGGTAVTFRLQPGSVDSIEVRVYDLSGRKVHSSSDFRFLGAIDDGNGKGAQNTYDHVWDVSGIGSGVYTYVMTAKKSGQSGLRKTGKVGVIR